MLSAEGPVQRKQLVDELEQLRKMEDERRQLSVAHAELDRSARQQALELSQLREDLAAERQQREQAAVRLATADKVAPLEAEVERLSALVEQRAQELKEAQRACADHLLDLERLRQQLQRREAAFAELESQFAVVEKRLEDASQQLRIVVEKDRRLQEMEARTHKACGRAAAWCTG